MLASEKLFGGLEFFGFERPSQSHFIEVARYLIAQSTIIAKQHRCGLLHAELTIGVKQV